MSGGGPPARMIVCCVVPSGPSAYAERFVLTVRIQHFGERHPHHVLTDYIALQRPTPPPPTSPNTESGADHPRRAPQRIRTSGPKRPGQRYDPVLAPHRWRNAPRRRQKRTSQSNAWTRPMPAHAPLVAAINGLRNAHAQTGKGRPDRSRRFPPIVASTVWRILHAAGLRHSDYAQTLINLLTSADEPLTAILIPLSRPGPARLSWPRAHQGHSGRGHTDQRGCRSTSAPGR